MTTFARYDPATEELSVQTMPQNQFEMHCRFWEVPDGTDPNTIYVKNDEIKFYPDKPSAEKFWQFDLVSETWIDPRSAEYKDVDLQIARAKAVKDINVEAGKVRGRYITIAGGMEMQYIDKERQAIAFLADPEPSESKYPNIYGEVGLYGEDDTPTRVATIIVDMSNMWRIVSAQLERVRLEFITAIEVCDDVQVMPYLVDQCIAVFDQFTN